MPDNQAKRGIMSDSQIVWKLINKALEMVIVFDAGGTITYANNEARRLLQFGPEIIGKNINLIFPGVFFSEKNEYTYKGANTDEVLKTMAYRSNRTCFAVDLQVISQDDRYVCMALDVSMVDFFEKKVNQSEQSAEEAQTVKTHFVANVTHELRTPVNGILGNTRELLECETDDNKIKTLRLIERGCKDMHSIINNILDFSKLDSGKFILENNKFDFKEMIEYIKSTHNSRIIEKGLQFQIIVSPDIPQFVIGDELRLQQILNNLLSNAVKFTYTGKITLQIVKTSQIKKRVELFFMVIDSGIGIAKDDQDRLFKSFSQVEASTTRKYGGTGLGLCICKQLVEMMNGTIHVESEKGKGSMFSFHIWVDLPEDENYDITSTVDKIEFQMPDINSMNETSVMLEYGTKENLDEINKKLSKLILCVDMENWEKAETFMESIRQLTADAPREIKSAVLKLKMAVQRNDSEKTSEAYDNFVNVLSESGGE